MRINVLGVGFDNVVPQEALERALEIISGGEKAYIVTPNPEIVWLCREDAELFDIVERAALVLPDGVGITLGARLLGTPLKGRVTGIDFTELLLAALSDSGGSVFLLGAKPGVAAAAAQKLLTKCPGLVIAGTADGYFKDDEPLIEQINLTKPDLLLVCLGAPKQEKWIAGCLDRLDTKLCIGLGGALDVLSGTVRRAPVLFQRLGLEWLYRLAREPRRIKRMIKLPMFIFAVIWQRISGIIKRRR